MAKAPKPGSTPNASKKKRSSMTIKLNGDSWTLNMKDLGPQDDLIARKETGYPVSRFVDEDTFGADTILVLIWTARRKAGEPKLKFRDVLAEFPSYDDLEGIEVEAEEAVEDDPLP